MTATTNLRRWTTAMWSLDELLAIETALAEVGRRIVYITDTTSWQHPRRWTEDPARPHPGKGLPIGACPEEVKIGVRASFALCWRNRALKRPLDYRTTYCTNEATVGLRQGRMLHDWHRVVTTGNSLPVLILTALEDRHWSYLSHWSMRWNQASLESVRVLARTASAWEAHDETYCAEHDIYDCPYDTPR